MKRFFLLSLFFLAGSQISFGFIPMNNETVDELCTVKNIGSDSYFICRDFLTIKNFSLNDKPKDYQLEAQNIIRNLYDLNSSYWNFSKPDVEKAQFTIDFTRKFGFGYDFGEKNFDLSYLNNLFHIIFSLNDSTKSTFYSLLNNNSVNLSNYYDYFLVDKLYQLNSFKESEFKAAYYYLKNSKFNKLHIDSLSQQQVYKIICAIFIKENLSHSENNILKLLFEQKLYSELVQNLKLSQESINLMVTLQKVVFHSNEDVLKEIILTQDIETIKRVLNDNLNKNLKFNNSDKEEYELAYTILINQALNYPFLKKKRGLYNSTLEDMFNLDEAITKEQVKIINLAFKNKQYDELLRYDILNHINKTNYKEVIKLIKQETVDFKAIEKKVKRINLYNGELFQ